jgi:hypothetical protein
MRTTTRIASIVFSLVAIHATHIWAQEPGGEADQTDTAKQVEAEDAGAKKTGWLPGGLSGNVAVYSDYSFRGISQTQRDAAIQGGVDWNHDSGLFVGFWGSPVDFTNASGTRNAYMESDWYGGFQGAIDSWSYKLSSTYFYYPGASTFDYWEFGAFTGYDLGFMSLSTGVIGSPDYFGSLGTGVYVPAGSRSRSARSRAPSLVRSGKTASTSPSMPTAATRIPSRRSSPARITIGITTPA